MSDLEVEVGEIKREKTELRMGVSVSVGKEGSSGESGVIGIDAGETRSSGVKRCRRFEKNPS
jgi:hypothetical protein